MRDSHSDGIGGGESRGVDEETHIVTAFLRNDGEVLLIRRSDAVGSYVGRWGGVSGYAEGDPDEQVWVEIAEETGLEESVSLVRSGRPVEVEDSDLDRTWIVHPYLFDCESRDVETSVEHDAVAWVSPTVILTDERETVPMLWETYERVAPRVRSIAADADHGAAYLSTRALEVLRDRAGVLVAERSGDEDGTVNQVAPIDRGAEWEELAALARRLLEARPSMAVLRNRVNRAMAEALDANGASGSTDDGAGKPTIEGADEPTIEGADEPTIEGADEPTDDGAGEPTDDDGAVGTSPRAGADALLDSAIDGIERALAADVDASTEAAERVDGSIATLSWSGTVLDAIRGGSPSRIFVAESRPECEGVRLAESLSEAYPVTLHTDAASAHVFAREGVDALLVGADTVLPDGAVVNKAGTRALALAARHEGIPVIVVAASDKCSTRESVNLESGSNAAVYDGDVPIDVANPTFDVTPAECVSELVTERGVLDPGDVESVVEELRAFESWHERK